MPHITRPSYTRTNNQTAGRGGGGASVAEQKQSSSRLLISLHTVSTTAPHLIS